MATPASNVLNFTGERFAPEVTGAIWYEHWHRYCVAQPLAIGLSVLDAACGEGYGSYLLAQTAREVVGIDIAAEAIGHARSRYTAPNLRYIEGSCTALPMAEASIDMVVSFETIEHLQQQREMLAEFRRVLVPGGVLIISSPNPPVYSDELQSRNEYHVRELTRDELAALLTPLFPQQKWYGQRVLANSALWAEEAPRQGRESSLIELLGDQVTTQLEPAPPMYFVVVCAAKNVKVPALPSLSLFDDGKQSLYKDYTRALLREKELYWQELDARNIAEARLAELITVTNDLASAKQQSTQLANRLVPLEDAYDAVKAELETERQYTQALTWEERNQRAIAEARLGELITTVNNLSSERDRAEALGQRLAALEDSRREIETELNQEREKRAAAEWEQRNAQSVAEERLGQLIAAVNTEPQRITILEWDVRNAQQIAEERLKELIKVTNELANERENFAHERENFAQEREHFAQELQNERQSFAQERVNERENFAQERVNERENFAQERENFARERENFAQERESERQIFAQQRDNFARERDSERQIFAQEREKSGLERDSLIREHARATEQLTQQLTLQHREHITALTAQITSLQQELASFAKIHEAVRGELDKERQQLASLQWEERDARKIAEDRLNEAIGTANQLTREREKVLRLTAELNSLKDARERAEAELGRERQRIVAVEWEERDARKVGEQRLAELIEAVNTLASEREKTMALTGRVTALESALTSTQADAGALRSHYEAVQASLEAQLANLQNDRDASFAQWAAERVEWREQAEADLATSHAQFEWKRQELEIEWSAKLREESENTRHFKDAAMSLREQFLAALDEVGHLRSQFGDALAELRVMRAQLDGTRRDLEEAETELAHEHWELVDVRARLGFRETLAGWLRWPLARIKSAVRRAG